MRDSLRRISVIFRKDFKDAIRDARFLMAVLLPLGIGLIYNTVIDDNTATPEASIVYFSPGQTALIDDIKTNVGAAVDLTIDQQDTASAVSQDVANGDADVGLVLPDGFDKALSQGDSPELKVSVIEDPGIGAQYVLASLDPSIRQLADQQFPAKLDLTTEVENISSQTAIERLGARDYTVLFSLVLMLVMIGMLAIPIILTEESEKKTLDALLMVSSDLEVLSAKAALGLSYMAVTMTTLFLLIRRHPEKMQLFFVSALLLGITVLGFGLLVATFLKNATQLNTWSGLFMFPVLAPAFAIGIGLSNRIENAANLTPTGAGMSLFLDSWTSKTLIGREPLSLAVIVVWGLAAYALALWFLRRRYT